MARACTQTCVCVCVRVSACVRVRACVDVCVGGGRGVYVHAAAVVCVCWRGAHAQHKQRLVASMASPTVLSLNIDGITFVPHAHMLTLH